MTLIYPFLLIILGKLKKTYFEKLLATFSEQVIYHLSQSAEKRCIFVSSILKGFPAFFLKNDIGVTGNRTGDLLIMGRTLCHLGYSSLAVRLIFFVGVIFLIVRSHHWWL